MASELVSDAPYITVRCPQCRAIPGRPCRTVLLRRVTAPHPQRVYLAGFASGLSSPEVTP